MTFDDQELLERDPLIERVLIPSADIQRRVTELGREISSDYKEEAPILVSVLKGAVVFMADLMRCISVPHEIDFMSVSSYQGGKQSSGVVKILMDLKSNITDRDVLIVEDIIDTGSTLSYLQEILMARKPRSLRLCTLLNKADARVEPIAIDYLGFDIPNEFVIGYGLDYAEKYRNLPFIGVMKG
jgi:hypoxanthine phosphoribosyltransferase